jgi:hypothetical protein
MLVTTLKFQHLRQWISSLRSTWATWKDPGSNQLISYLKWNNSSLSCALVFMPHLTSSLKNVGVMVWNPEVKWRAGSIASGRVLTYHVRGPGFGDSSGEGAALSRIEVWEFGSSFTIYCTSGHLNSHSVSGGILLHDCQHGQPGDWLSQLFFFFWYWSLNSVFQAY